MKFGYFALFASFLTSFSLFSQQLVINEISQGTSAKEYVEFLVMGTPSCASPVPCVDLRLMVINDNDGYFSASASGSGVAAGAVRFADIPFWSCVPQGTLIVIYNDADVNPALPSDDISMTDGNCRLIIPVNSILLEGESASPSTAVPFVYPSSGWVAGGGLWGQVAMSNTNDSFLIRNSVASPTPSFSVSWGNNNLNTQIYFPTASGAVFYMNNALNNNPTLQSNWSSGAVGSEETPGLANNLANSSWIASMNPQCGLGAPSLQVNLTATSESCPGLCDGSITSVVTNGVSPYVFSWSNSATTPNLSGLCPGTYAVQVTDFNGCTQNAAAIVLAGSTGGNVSIQSAGPFDISDGAMQLTTNSTGGVWSSNCGTCLSTTGIFSPNLAGVGTFQICYTVGAGACATVGCIDISVTSCVPQLTIETIAICPEDTIVVFGQTVTSSGSFSQLFVNSNGCDSTHTVVVQENLTFPYDFNQVLCEGDSILVYGAWIYTNYYGEQQTTDVNGCLVTNTATITFDNCYMEEFALYVPNVFTPNNDGVNDIFKIELSGGLLNEGFIMNRWGEIIATFDDSNRTWNGKSDNGFAVNEGVYTWLVYYTPIGKNQESVQGFVTVIR